MSEGVRPIDGNALCETLKDWRGDREGLDMNDVHAIAYYQAMSRAIRISEGAPVLDYAPVIRARWLLRDDGEGLRIVCSRCGRESKEEKPFCAECGARMDGGKENV